MPPLGRSPDSRSAGFLKNTVTFVPSRRFSLVEPLPRSQSAMCSSSKTIVLPRGLTWANPLGSTVPTRHTWAGNAVLMCSCRALGILAKSHSPFMAPRGWSQGDSSAPGVLTTSVSPGEQFSTFLCLSPNQAPPSRPPHEDGAEEQEYGADNARRVDRNGRHIEPAEVIDHHRGDELPENRGANDRRRAHARKRDHSGHHGKDGQPAARPGPPWGLGEPAKVAALEQPRHHQDRQEHAAHDEGDERAQRGRLHGLAQSAVRRDLNGLPQC